MSAAARDRAIAVALTAGAFVLALVQRPGRLIADTKVDLYVDPVDFVSRVASAWTPTGQLGHIFGGQYGGYLFPMAPWFALGDLAGVPMWVVHRLWLGAGLAAAGPRGVHPLRPVGGGPRRAAAGPPPGRCRRHPD